MSTSPRGSALVTGGATGIGAAISERLAADGYDVLVAQRTVAAAQRGIARMRSTKGRLIPVGGDLATRSGCEAIAAACEGVFGGLDVLVNNAAITGRRAVGALASMPDSVIDEIISVNLGATIRCSRLAIPLMASSERPAIVNISSVAAVQAQADAAVYCASKSGVEGFTRALALELAGSGIRVVSVTVGAVETETSSESAYAAERAASPYSKKPPIGRLGEPQEIAHAVGWLVSPEASYITGSAIIVDGGLTSF